MTTILSPPLSGASPFDRPSTRSSSYPDLSSLQESMQYDPDTRMKSSPYHQHTHYQPSYASSAPSSAPPSPTYTQSSRFDSDTSTPVSSASCDDNDVQMDDKEEPDTPTPTFDQPPRTIQVPPLRSPIAIQEDAQSSQTHSPAHESTTELPDKVHDDEAVQSEPSRHVDYLSHEWREEDIWSSWRYIVRQRGKISNGVRLENASWRTWMKAKYGLKTISPETLNWLKDCDVTWLYGPLQVETRKSLSYGTSQPMSHLSKSSSFLCKKPILKKKSASAVILERSRSQHSLLQRASEIIRQQQSSPAHGKSSLRRPRPDFQLPSFTGSSVANTPNDQLHSSLSSQRTSFTFPEVQTPTDQKHVLFNEEVRQMQAIDSDDEDDKASAYATTACDSDEDEDGGLIMAPTRSRSNRSTPRGSFSGGDNNNITLIPLPSTTLKYRTDTPEPAQSQARSHPSFWPASGRKLSPSPSQETLRPARPHQNFLIDDDPELSDEPWNPGHEGDFTPYEDENEPGPNMRRTPSGMFMPYDENENEAITNKTLVGQAIYAVNTFKDIAHVVWNVGWNRR